MNKVICEICGTSYPETAEQCPICGYTQDMGAALREELEAAEIAVSQVRLPVKDQQSQPQDGDIDQEDDLVEADLLDVQQEKASEQEAEEPDEYAYDDEPRESSALLVFLLVLVIAALLAATAFIAVKYVIPNVLPEETTVPTVTTEPPTTQETEPPTVPCTNLVLTSGGTVTLEKEGQYWLLNVVILPVDSTDKLTYESSDASVAIVNGEGRVTAVAAGEAVITIRCGEQSLECRIICDIPEETTAPEVEEDAENTDATDETQDSTDPT